MLPTPTTLSIVTMCMVARRGRQRLRLTHTSCMLTMECSLTTTTPMCTIPWSLSERLRRLRPRLQRPSPWSPLPIATPTPTPSPTSPVSTLDTWSAPSSTPWFPLWPLRRWRRERLRLLLRLRLTPGTHTQGMHLTPDTMAADLMLMLTTDTDTGATDMDSDHSVIMESKQKPRDTFGVKHKFLSNQTGNLLQICSIVAQPMNLNKEIKVRKMLKKK